MKKLLSAEWGYAMFDLNTVGNVFLSVLTVVPQTIGVAIIILLVSVFLGAVLAIIRQNNLPVLKSLASGYVSIMRGIPLVVLLYVVYYALPEIPPVYIILLTYSFYMAAFEAENIRGALSSVDKAQIEAASSIGLTAFQTVRRIILPQAFVVAMPNFCNGFLGIIKGLSLAFMVTFVDILAKAKLNAALNFRYIESFMAAALVYWITCIVLTAIFKLIEKHLAKGRQQILV